VLQQQEPKDSCRRPCSPVLFFPLLFFPLPRLSYTLPPDVSNLLLHSLTPRATAYLSSPGNFYLRCLCFLTTPYFNSIMVSAPNSTGNSSPATPTNQRNGAAPLPADPKEALNIIQRDFRCESRKGRSPLQPSACLLNLLEQAAGAPNICYSYPEHH
jgi:hypothetical protein